MRVSCGRQRLKVRFELQAEFQPCLRDVRVCPAKCNRMARCLLSIRTGCIELVKHCSNVSAIFGLWIDVLGSLDKGDVFGT